MQNKGFVGKFKTESGWGDIGGEEEDAAFSTN
jgi:hypothetical protein